VAAAIPAEAADGAVLTPRRQRPGWQEDHGEDCHAHRRTLFEAKKKDNLDEIYAQIAEELRGQYLLTYTPDKVDTDGGYHKIALKASKDDLQVVTREGYYAPGGDTK
jgi:hypothetical protein